MAKRACPQCAKPLTLLVSNGLHGDACHECGGIWLAAEIYQRVGKELEASTELSTQAGALATEPFPKHADAPPCPDCGAAMRALAIPKTNVEVDACALHGTWLDRGELETMVHAIAARRATKTPGGPKRVSHDDERRPTHADVASDAALDAVQGAAISMAIDVGFGLLGALLSGNDRR